MKIIFICTKSITFNSFLKSQADYFLKRGIEVEVACSDVENLNFKNNATHNIDFPDKIIKFFNLINYIKAFIQIKKLIKNNPSKIFYIHTPVASHLFRLFTFFNKLKIIYFVHGFRFQLTSKSIKNFFFKIIEKALSYKTDIFITINKHDFNYAKLKLASKRACYKVNGVGLNLSPKHFKKKIRKKRYIKKILVIAAYKKEKGYSEILKVAELLEGKNIKIECFGYGNFDFFNSIKLEKKLDNISFNYFDNNLKKKIKNFDIMLHLSKREGLPVGVMESLSEGLPVICYDVRGNNDLIKDKFNGYFVNSYKDVPHKIYHLNSKKKILNKMSFNAFKSINKDFVEKKINLQIYKIIKKHFIQ